MKKHISVCSVLVLITGLLQAVVTPVRLTCENLKDPLVIDVLKPRLSWVNLSQNKERGQYQTAWEIRVAGTRDKLVSGKAELWNSGKVMSAKSVNIPYEGTPLASRQDCWWQVRVWDRNDRMSGWSKPAFWSMGLLKSEEWTAQWIGAPWQEEEPLSKPVSPGGGGKAGNRHPGSENTPPPAPLLRKKFILNKEVASARAFVTGLGFFEFYVNGVKAGTDVLAPNLTLYGKREDLGPIGAMIRNNFREYRVMYLSYDIKKFLHKGENVIGAMLGNGFYNPGYYWTGGYGTPRFIGQIYIKYTDGTEQVIKSDLTWKASKSPVLMDLIYDGEHYDARMEQPGWCSTGFDDSGWETAAARKAPEGIMKAQMSPPDGIMEKLAPQKIEKLGEGHFKADFGQEISGWLHLMKVTGEKGRKIEIKYICESPVGDNSYTMKGGRTESYATRFTWYVFRTVEIINWPGELKPEQIRAEAVYSDVETTGNFECSNTLFNTINKIWWRSQTDNMHGGIASDCPHRERSPYTGDGQVSCVTVMHNFDARTFYTKWIQDILGAQNPETGYVPNGAPWQPGCGGGVAWGAAMNIMPWEYYLHYGDIDLLRHNYDGMKGYVKYMLTWTDADGIMFSQAPDSANPNQWINLGDWVAPGKLPPDDMVHTFYLWRCASLTANAARALGENEDEIFYNSLAEKTRLAFQKKYFDNSLGTYGPHGGNIFALKMGVPEDQKERVVSSLSEDIMVNDDHLDTGIFGTQFFFEVLTENRLNELAYRVMNQRTMPSYGWWIGQGATTTWEEWNGNGSHNHPMFGGGISWFYRYLAGINPDPDDPGYRHIIFKPVPPKDISFAKYSNLTPYGTASIGWKKDKGYLSMDIIVPVGCTATVWVPANTEDEVMENGKRIAHSENISFLYMKDGYAVYNIASGDYGFTSTLKQ
jgi:alpha-L-rhamnosidase